MRRLTLLVMLTLLVISLAQAASYRLMVKVPQGSGVQVDDVVAAIRADSLEVSASIENAAWIALDVPVQAMADTSRASGWKALFPAIDCSLVVLDSLGATVVWSTN